MNTIASTDLILDLLGKTAYDAYCDLREWKSFDGKPLPRWPDVKPEIKAGWVKAASAVIEALNSHCVRCFEPIHRSGTTPTQVSHALCRTCHADYDGGAD